MTKPKPNRLKEAWLMVWGFITRPLATCNNFDCYPFMVSFFQEDSNGDAGLLVNDEDEDQGFLYIYYCPVCGRRVKR